MSFEIRVASLIQKISLMSQATGPEGLPLVEVLKQISKMLMRRLKSNIKS